MSQLLRLPDVLQRTGLKRSSMYALIAEARFPAPVKISERSSAWPAGDVENWIRATIEASRKGA